MKGDHEKVIPVEAREGDRGQLIAWDNHYMGWISEVI